MPLFTTVCKVIASFLSQFVKRKIFVFAVAQTDTHAKIPLKHCLHQHPSTACIVSNFYTASCVFRTCCNWALVMWCTICFTNYRKPGVAVDCTAL